MRGGGILLAINSRYQSMFVALNILSGEFDITCATLKISGGVFYVFAVYLVPVSNIDVYRNLYEYIESVPFVLF